MIVEAYTYWNTTAELKHLKELYAEREIVIKELCAATRDLLKDHPGHDQAVSRVCEALAKLEGRI